MRVVKQLQYCEYLFDRSQLLGSCCWRHVADCACVLKLSLVDLFTPALWIPSGILNVTTALLKNGSEFWNVSV